MPKAIGLGVFEGHEDTTRISCLGGALPTIDAAVVYSPFLSLD